MKKIIKDVLTAPVVILLFFFFLVVSPVSFILKWVFRVPYVFFRGVYEICATFWKALAEAYENKKRAVVNEKEKKWIEDHKSKVIASTERVN